MGESPYSNQTEVKDSQRTAFTYYSSPSLGDHQCRDGCELVVTGSLNASTTDTFELESLQLLVSPNDAAPFISAGLEKTVPTEAELVSILPDSPIPEMDASAELSEFLRRPGELVGFDEGELFLNGIRDVRLVDGPAYHLQLFAWSTSALDCDASGSIDEVDFTCLSGDAEVILAIFFGPLSHSSRTLPINEPFRDPKRQILPPFAMSPNRRVRE